MSHRNQKYRPKHGHWIKCLQDLLGSIKIKASLTPEPLNSYLKFCTQQSHQGNWKLFTCQWLTSGHYVRLKLRQRPSRLFSTTTKRKKWPQSIPFCHFGLLHLIAEFRRNICTPQPLQKDNQGNSVGYQNSRGTCFSWERIGDFNFWITFQGRYPITERLLACHGPLVEPILCVPQMCGSDIKNKTKK